ncbi:protein-disulfide reductase DsbD [Pseudidiomarina insulisalsae]|uniref:Thiol:disulfide interchange protein DsbD n=1 Tax=Pseudidiomarina insulisalsae TaxID=575789 RepID=A0A432YQG7_9GAMM|nr:protein-disulfide reductase DsbD [Pseudidiomarina insulisalsae]RUO63499.1 protein-disulfide reductase DsbD [Pseudidiomarina insulisalsae]
MQYHRRAIAQVVAPLIALWFALFSSVSLAQDFSLNTDDPFSQNQFLPVDEAFRFDFQQRGAQLFIRFDIADGYYLYQHRFQFDPEVPLAAAPELPRGEAHFDEFFGESVIYRDAVEIQLTLATTTATTFSLDYQGCADAGLCYPPTTVEIPLQAVSDSGPAIETDATATIDFAQVAANSQQFSANSLFRDLNEEPLIWVLLIFFIAGIGLAFTPCVLPMYPILSTVIMGPQKKLSTGRAFTLSFAYVQGMAITYSALGIVVALAGMRYQAMLQHPVVLVVLAVLFVLLALSMLGFYNLQLPASWQNYLNQISQQQRGGAHRSVFVMGVLSGLIASPCTTAPLSGVLLFIAQSGDLTVGASVLYALSLGMGLPLILFGTTGGKLLPKAGAWMVLVKRIFGVVLLAVAVLFIERLLPVQVADWLWVAFISLSALYLIVTTLRDVDHQLAIVISAAWLALASWLLVLWWPQGDHAELPFNAVASVAQIEEQVTNAAPEQLVMLDLYADWCVACKEFERYTFSDPAVQQALAGAVLLQADVTANNSMNNAILQRYRVLGLPTILFFRDGELINNARISGFLDAEAFLQHLRELEKAQNLP